MAGFDDGACGTVPAAPGSASVLFGFTTAAEEMPFPDAVRLLSRGPAPRPLSPRDRPGRHGAGLCLTRVVSCRTPAQGPSAIDHLLTFSDLLS